MHPARSRRASSKVLLTLVIAVLLAIGVLAIPVRQRCGAPGLACATAVDPWGNVHYYYEVEPLGVYLAEIVTGSNIRLYYTSGEDVDKASTLGHEKVTSWAQSHDAPGRPVPPMLA
jgi:hypothetical protein